MIHIFQISWREIGWLSIFNSLISTFTHIESRRTMCNIKNTRLKFPLRKKIADTFMESRISVDRFKDMWFGTIFRAFDILYLRLRDFAFPLLVRAVI